MNYSASLTLSTIERYTNLKRKTDTEYAGPCPFCGGEDRFVVFIDDKPGWICRHCRPDKRGDVVGFIMKMENISYLDACKRLGISNRGTHGQDMWYVKDGENWKSYQINASYVYNNKDGEPVFRVVRWTSANGNTKNFGQQHPDKTSPSGWRQGAKNIDYIPYNLPSVLEAIQNGDTIYIVEGEKAVDYLTSRGICATTNVGGAGMGKRVYTQSYCKWFHGGHIVVVADNDNPGITHAKMIASKLKPYASSIDVRLSGNWKELNGHQGLDDWLSSGGNIHDIPSIPDDNQITVQASKERPITENLIDITSGILEDAVAQIWDYTLKYYKDKIFLYKDTLVLYNNGEIIPIDIKLWRGIVSRCCLRYNSKSKTNKFPFWSTNDAEIVDAFLPINIPKGIRKIDLITKHPIFSQDGKLLRNGYHENERVLVDTDIKDEEMEICDAKAWLAECFCDFPFATDADYANLIAYLLQPFIKLMIGNSPLYLIEASRRGTGKGLLNNAIHAIWGIPYEVSSLPLEEEEQRKTITSLMMRGSPSIIFDDISTIRGHAIQSVITATIWNDRLLGKSQTVNIPVNIIMSATGNNVSIGGDMERRIVQIRLESRTENPEDRKDIKRPGAKLIQWITQNRSKLVSACLSIIKNGLENGEEPDIVFGSFEEYASVIGKILSGVGIKGFLKNRKELRARDDRRLEWKTFIKEWFLRFGEATKQGKEILSLIDEMKNDITISIKGETNQARVISLGKELSRLVGEVYEFHEFCVRLVRETTCDNKSRTRNGFALKKINPNPNPKRDPDPEPKRDPDPEPKQEPDPEPLELELKAPDPEPKREPDPEPLELELKAPDPSLHPHGGKKEQEAKSLALIMDNATKELSYLGKADQVERCIGYGKLSYTIEDGLFYFCKKGTGEKISQGHATGLAASLWIKRVNPKILPAIWDFLEAHALVEKEDKSTIFSE